MNGFPKIKGIKWMAEDFPDIIGVSVTLVNRSIQALDIPGLAIPETEGIQYIDLSLLAGLTSYYAKETDEPSETECSVDVDGLNNFIADVKLEDFIEAWIFYKRFKYSKRL